MGGKVQENSHRGKPQNLIQEANEKKRGKKKKKLDCGTDHVE